MTEKKPCPLCKTECEIYSIDPLQQLFAIDCLLCGKYNLTDRAKEHLASLKDSFYIISGVTRNFYELHKDTGGVFVIKWEMIRDDAKFQAEFISKAPNSVTEKASLLLQYIARNSNEKPSTSIEITIENDYPIIFCKDKEELYFYINYLKHKGLINSTNLNPELLHLQDVPRKYKISLTFEGWIEVEKLQRPNYESKQAFIAMWFNEQTNEAFEKGILPLGIEKDECYTGFKMFRVDKESFNNEKICDKIITEIKKSRFLIADVTGHRQAVYFEAGYAMAMGLPVIWTCKDEKEHTGKCCFDTRQYPHIFWKDADDLKNRLKNKIMADIVKIKK